MARTPRTILIWVDRLGAWLVGWSGRNTISAEWGSRSCVLCRVGCRLLEKIDRLHCFKSAEAAGLPPAEHVVKE